jgi:hypothetical protein
VGAQFLPDPNGSVPVGCVAMAATLVSPSLPLAAEPESPISLIDYWALDCYRSGYRERKPFRGEMYADVYRHLRVALDVLMDSEERGPTFKRFLKEQARICR